MSERDIPSLSVHQCLFGYQDGHKLIASSSKLKSSTETYLLKLSDLAPGVPKTAFESYVTGIPLKDEGIYALLRTWPAPEQSRPGCVWTHALLIRFSDLPQMEDLSPLAHLFSKPATNTNFEGYRKSIVFHAESIESGNSDKKDNISNDSALALLRCLYGERDGGCVFYAREKISERLLFGIWSQQWPRLRRAFSFRSLSEDVPVRNLEFGAGFDLVLLKTELDIVMSDKELLCLEELHEWERILADDLFSPTSTNLRKFLWRYGSDIANGFKAFNLLARLFSRSANEDDYAKNFESICDLVFEFFPDVSEARLLKSDIFPFSSNRYSLLPRIESLRSYRYLVMNSKLNEQFAVDQIHFDDLAELVSSNDEELFEIAEKGARKTGKLVSLFLDELASELDASEFFTVTKKYRRLRARLVQLRPALLCSEELVDVSDEEVYELIQFLPRDRKLAGKIVSLLLVVDNQEAVRYFVENYPKVVLDSLVSALERQSESSSLAVSESWSQAARHLATEFYEGNYLSKCKQVRSLAMFARQFSESQYKVSATRVKDWISALSNVIDWENKSDKDFLYAFVAKIAIQNPSRTSLKAVEFTFDYLHDQLNDSCLTLESRLLLESVFGYRNWWDSWDSSYYFCKAVAKLINSTGASREVVESITSDKDALSRLKRMVRG